MLIIYRIWNKEEEENKANGKKQKKTGYDPINSNAETPNPRCVVCRLYAVD